MKKKMIVFMMTLCLIISASTASFAVVEEGDDYLAEVNCMDDDWYASIRNYNGSQDVTIFFQVLDKNFNVVREQTYGFTEVAQVTVHQSTPEGCFAVAEFYINDQLATSIVSLGELKDSEINDNFQASLKYSEGYWYAGIENYNGSHDVEMLVRIVDEDCNVLLESTQVFTSIQKVSLRKKAPEGFIGYAEFYIDGQLVASLGECN